MKLYSYSWPKGDGGMGTKRCESPTELLYYIVDGTRDRTQFAESQGIFIEVDTASSNTRLTNFAEVIRLHLKEVELKLQNKSEEDFIASLNQK